LIESKLAVADSLFVYGTGHLVLWVGKSSPIDLARLQMHALEAPAVKHIAIANPQHAPYGRAAEAALRSSGIYDRVASKLVLGENIAQTFQFAQSGTTEIGIVALALALAPAAREQGRYWEIPADSYPKMDQAGVVLAHAANPADARVFRAFMMSDAGRKALKSYGFY
jgi:molybdate transport system substrate-binding protein